jgi:S-disulfanyl-L-cysteine oxidoreductase SoxD
LIAVTTEEAQSAGRTPQSELKVMRIATLALWSAGIFVGLFGAVGAQQVPTVWDGVYSAPQAERGRALYDAQCAMCHGEDLQGVEMATPLVDGAFLNAWDRQTVGDLSERVRATMPANNPGSLGLGATADIVAYILSSNQFPAGAKALPPEAAAQRTIRILAAKPSGH